MAYKDGLTVFGSFGFGNLGDELVPECFRNLLQAADRPVDVGVLSRFQGISIGESAPFPDVDTPTDGPQTGTIVLAGGGIIEARDMSCMNRAFKLQNARAGLRVATHAISVEPGVAFSWRQRRALKQQLAHIGTSTVRDVLSAETLMRLVPNHTTRVIGDIALWMEPEALPAALEAKLPERSIAVIIGDFWDTQDFFDWLTTDLLALARSMQASLLLVPFSGAFGKDFALNDKLRAQLTAADPTVEVISALDEMEFADLTPARAAALLERSMLTVSMRLHGCVVSYAMRTPFLGLAYHPKLRGFAETVGHSGALVPGKLPALQTPKTYGYAFADLDIREGLLQERAEAVLADPDFSAIPYFRRLQVAAVRDMLDRLEASA